MLDLVEEPIDQVAHAIQIRLKQIGSLRLRFGELRLRFGSLNYIHGRTINPQRPVVEPLMLGIYFRFRRHSGHGRTFCWLAPVANDPTRTFLDRGGQSKRREHCVAHLWLPGPPAVCYRLCRSRVHPGCAGLAHPLSPGSIGLICLNAAVRAGGERQKRRRCGFACLEGGRRHADLAIAVEVFVDERSKSSAGSQRRCCARGRAVCARPARELAALVISALGVVYGDIGTSPLYAIDQIFLGPAGVAPTPENVLGAISLAIWTITLIVAVKYALLVLRAENDGEGGVFALYGLLHKYKNQGA